MYRNKSHRLAVSALLILSVAFSGSSPAAATGHASKVDPILAVPTDLTASRVRPTPNRAAQPVERCKNKLIGILTQAGFTGPNLREAWAIVMRETGGTANPRVVSRTHDYGLFQFNRAAHRTQPWWDQTKLLTAEYNAKVAYRMSKGGRTWYAWGLDGQGRVKAGVYRSIGWSETKIEANIAKPFRKRLAEFDALPSACTALAAPTATA